MVVWCCSCLRYWVLGAGWCNGVVVKEVAKVAEVVCLSPLWESQIMELSLTQTHGEPIITCHKLHHNFTFLQSSLHLTPFPQHSHNWKPLLRILFATIHTHRYAVALDTFYALLLLHSPSSHYGRRRHGRCRGLRSIQVKGAGKAIKGRKRGRHGVGRQEEVRGQEGISYFGEYLPLAIATY